mmetsp:Transcript_26984/g.62930  ORF Transcript_26984/g.62930 Transcript_26984/m.62930 type:complete len:309 (-) Transcript_26984:816-1742(-)
MKGIGFGIWHVLCTEQGVRNDGKQEARPDQYEGHVEQEVQCQSKQRSNEVVHWHQRDVPHERSTEVNSGLVERRQLQDLIPKTNVVRHHEPDECDAKHAEKRQEQVEGTPDCDDQVLDHGHVAEVLDGLPPQKHRVHGMKQSDSHGSEGNRSHARKRDGVMKSLLSHVEITRFDEVHDPHAEGNDEDDHVQPIQDVPEIEEVVDAVNPYFLELFDYVPDHEEHHNNDPKEGDPVRREAQPTGDQAPLVHRQHLHLRLDCVAWTKLHHDADRSVRGNIGTPHVELDEDRAGGCIEKAACPQIDQCGSRH